MALLNDLLVQVSLGIKKRVIISMPPRSGKSELVSKYFPAWYLGVFPERRVILTSYEADFASSWGRKARDILTEWGPLLFGVSVSDKSSAADRWDIAGKPGGMVTAGVGGAITGRGSDLLIIDDPIKNAEDAYSATIRQKQWEWFTSTAYTRLEPAGVIILVMTRWHADDLAGHLLSDFGDDWVTLSLPAIAETDESYSFGLEDRVYGRSTGEALWPGRFNIEALARIKRDVGSRVWTALYQQRPAPEEGDRFRRQWFRYWSYAANDTVYQLGTDTRVPVDACWKFGTMDLAASEKATADYTVIGIWAVTPDNDLLLLDIIRAQVSAAEHDALIESVFAQHALSFLGIESVQYQLSLVQRMTGKGYPIKKLKADRDKVSRSLVASARYEIGAMYHKANAPWLDAYEDELLHFPNGKHDDQTDVAGYAAIAIIPDGNERIGIPVTFLSGSPR